jgi:hypothetical protein
MTSLSDTWTALRDALAKVDLDAAASVSPADLVWARGADHPRGSSLPEPPASYRAFIDAVGGYPMFGLGYYDREGFSFLPPSPMAVISANLPGPDDEWPVALPDAPTPCPFAFFAGYDLSDIEGWAFGPDGKVWEVERGMAREPLGDFEPWMTQLLADALARFQGASEEELQAMRDDVAAESDPHRLWDYSLEGWPRRPRTDEDRRLHWVCHQAGSPYSYGLIDEEGTWRIPMGKRFMSVRPFAQGTAEVILAGPGSSYSGPWVHIGPDGTPCSDEETP